MKKIIVTTTINEPTEALLRYSRYKDWQLIVVGDLKTPHKKFSNLKNSIYLSPKDQEKISKKLSDAIGWNCIQRRNIGFVLASKMGASVVATVDDDNIPMKNWGKDLYVNKEVKVNVYSDKLKFFDPLSVTEHKNLWHRGFPIQLIHQRKPKIKKSQKIKCLVQADFWNGDPDIDAICRISQSPEVKFKKFKPFTSDLITPFNSQNTFISGKILKYYPMLPWIGRMDDIWGAYFLQFKLNKKNPFIVFNNASVYQKRNKHNLFVDLKNEMIGYENSLNLNRSNIISKLPKKTQHFLKIYSKCF